MTFSESKTQKSIKDPNDNTLEIDEPIIDSQSLTTGEPKPFSAEPKITQLPTESSQEAELKAMLERDRLQANSGIIHGNAIQKQKQRAIQSGDRTSVQPKSQQAIIQAALTKDRDNELDDEINDYSFQKKPPTSKFKLSSYKQKKHGTLEYEYHTDRILFAVLIGLVVTSLVGWFAYMVFGRTPENAGATQRYENVTFQTSTVPASFESSTKTVLPVPSKPEPVAVESTSAPVNETLSASAPPAHIEPPAQPAFELSNQPARVNDAVNQAEMPSTIPNNQPTPAQASILEPELIARASLARTIEALEPSGIYEQAQVSMEGRSRFRLAWFTQFTNLEDQTVSHRWYYQDQPAAQVNMKIGSVSWRASSNKLMTSNTLGQWRVEAVDAAGKVLARQTFELIP